MIQKYIGVGKNKTQHVNYLGRVEVGANLMEVMVGSQLNFQEVQNRTITLLCPADEWMINRHPHQHIVPVSVLGKVDSQDEYVLLMLATVSNKSSDQMIWDSIFIKYI